MQMLFEAVYKSAMQGHLVLSLGGDHSIGIGSVAGSLKARPETAVVWVVSRSARSSVRL
jgi:arginase